MNEEKGGPRRRDQDDQEQDMTAAVGPAPTTQLGGRIDWHLDQEWRRMVSRLGGTYRQHLEQAMRDYLAKHEQN